MRVKTAHLGHSPRVESCSEGGVLTWGKGHKYPVHGYPTEDGLLATEMLKKYVMGWVRILSKPTPSNWIIQFERYCEGVVEMYFDIKLLSPAVLALYETCIEIRPERIKTIKGICVFLEQDKGYRWPFQDVMMCADRWRLEHGPGKELRRLISIYFEREQRGDYKKLAWVFKLITLSPKVRKMVSEFAKKADFKRFNMDRYDLWGALQSGVLPAKNEQGYKYGGFEYEKRVEMYSRL